MAAENSDKIKLLIQEHRLNRNTACASTKNKNEFGTISAVHIRINEVTDQTKNFLVNEALRM